MPNPTRVGEWRNMKKKKLNTVLDGPAIGYISHGGIPVCKIVNRRKEVVMLGSIEAAPDPRMITWASNWPHRLKRELKRLHEAGIVTYEDAANKTRAEIEKIRRVGPDSVDHMEGMLRMHNMWFKSSQASFSFD